MKILMSVFHCMEEQCTSHQLADTPALPCWVPICSLGVPLWNRHPWKWSKGVWVWPLGTWCSGEHSGAGLTAGIYDLGSLFHLNDSVVLWMVGLLLSGSHSHRLLSLRILVHQVKTFIRMKILLQRVLWKLEFPQQKCLPQ